MKYLIDKNSKVSAYLQIYSLIRADIVSGVLPFGAKLPSKRTIAADADVSVITVEHAYAILFDEGYIDSKERSGYYVIFRTDGLSGQNLPEKKPILNFNTHSGGSEFPVSVYAKACRKILLDCDEKLFVKSPNNGLRELRVEISRYLSRCRGISAEPSQIVIGSGAEYLYGLCVAIFGSDCVFAIENPSYDKIRKVYELYGAQIEQLRLGKAGIESSELASSKATVLHVTPFESFPSGITASASKRCEYVKWAADRKGFIIEDDFGSEFSVSSKAEDTLFSLSQDERVVYINSFSKTIAPSLRVGYMVLPKSLVEVYQKKVGFCSCTVPIFEQYLLCELLSSGDFERHISRTRRKLRKNLENSGK